MRLGTRLDPRAEEGGRGISSGGGYKLVGRLTEGSIRTKSDRPKPNVEPLVELSSMILAARRSLDDAYALAIPRSAPRKLSNSGGGRPVSAQTVARLARELTDQCVAGR